MSQCKIPTPQRYCGSLYKFWCDVSLQDVIDCGIKVWWHENVYEDHGWYRDRLEEREEPKWNHLHKESDIDLERQWDEYNGRHYKHLLAETHIFYKATDEQFKKLMQVEAENNIRREKYWEEYRNSDAYRQECINWYWRTNGPGVEPAYQDKMNAKLKGQL